MTEDQVANARPDNDVWLRDLAALDWPSLGFPPLAQWDAALRAAVRMVGRASSAMALLLGRRGVIVANAPAMRLFAETAGGDINGRSVLDALPEGAAFYAQVLEEVFAGRGVSFREQPIRLQLDGVSGIFRFNMDFTPVTDADGRVLAALGVAFDVTDSARRIRSLRASEYRLRHALEGSGLIGVWTLDIASGVLLADANVADLYGAPPQQWGSLNRDIVVQAVHPDDRARVVEALEDAIQENVPCRFRYRVMVPGRRLRWVDMSARPSFGDDGGLARMLGVLTDVTDQVETASALAESRFHFQAVIETLPQIIWSADGRGKHDYFSPRWSEFTGVSPEDVTEDTWKSLVYPDHWEQVQTVWGQSLQTGEPYDLNYRFRHHSGEYRWLRVMALPMRDDRGRITRWFGSSTDIHDSYRMAEEREKFAAELERIASEDQLTQVLTRRAFMERAERVLASAASADISLMMMDLDHFKSINDAHGHPAGDRVLAAAAGRIRGALKEGDLIGRVGGEEFAILLPGADHRQALRVAERIRRAMAAEPVSLDEADSVPVTVSIGVAAGAGQGLDQFLSAADRALYDAKRSGRNRIVCAAGMTDQPPQQ